MAASLEDLVPSLEDLVPALEDLVPALEDLVPSLEDLVQPAVPSTKVTTSSAVVRLSRFMCFSLPKGMVLLSPRKKGMVLLSPRKAASLDELFPAGAKKPKRIFHPTRTAPPFSG